MNTFISKRHRVASSQLVAAIPERVFQLLCPKREYEWIPTWDCEIIHTQSGYAELDCIFVTGYQTEEEETWVVDRYEPNHLIQFILFSKNRVTRYSITLEDYADGATRLVWEQTITARNEEGNRFVEAFSDEAFAEKISRLENLLNQYLKISNAQDDEA